LPKQLKKLDGPAQGVKRTCLNRQQCVPGAQKGVHS